MIKKFCLLVLISLFWFNGLNAAEKISVNKLLADGFKIENDETKIADGNVFKIYTLKKNFPFSEIRFSKYCKSVESLYKI